MKKMMVLALAMFFATIAVAQEQYTISQKIEQNVVKGSLVQTVFAGENIETIQILYENTGFGESSDPEYKEGSTKLTDNFGLTKRWTKGPICEISGQMRSDIPAGTYKAYIVVQDDEGKYAITEFTFIVKEKPFSFEWDEGSGDLNQNVDAGTSISPIIFNYEGIKKWGVSGLPSGLKHDIVDASHKIIISGTVDSDVMSDDYEYKVSVWDNQDVEHVESGTITVKGSSAVTAIRVVENEKQKVVAGDSIKPVVFRFANVRVDGNLSSFNTGEGSLKGSLKYSVKGDELTVSGVVNENLQDGSYSIKIIVKGENNCDTAFASVEVAHKPVVTKVTILENASQTLMAGDSIKPIVFQVEHGSNPELTNFPGGYELRKNGDVVTIVGLLEKNAKGVYEIVLSVSGVDNNASAKATIEVVTEITSSSSKEGSSSSKKTDGIVAETVPGFAIGYMNNELSVTLLKASMVRVQVFDLMGHLVEAFAEPVGASGNFSFAHLDKGNYVVRIESGRMSRTMKVLVK